MTLATILAVLPGASICRAAGLEKLLMPGPLAKAHADLEDNCSACHDRTDRSRQRALCLACHKDVAQDVARRAGFHGRLPNIGSGECKACHSEHLGREADIVKLVPAAFDHSATDFRLENAHATAPCESCHVAGKKFREASASCGACHRADDVHRGGLGADCGSCHVTLTWRNPKFDHAKTGFPLLGGHATTACGACHLAGRYRDTPKRCIACHAPDDVHRGSRGEDCAACHVASAWSTARFDHARETGFALLGRHATLDCAGCHRSAKFDDKPPRTCVGCHRTDDAHAERFGENCATCHGNDTWQAVSFDHARDAKFALTGRHARVDCHACHTARVAVQKLPTDCASCHRGADVHGGAQRVACDSCHGTDGWREDLRFDHDLSSFPLLGMHVMVGCGQCHATRAYAGTPHECVACHRSSDVHQGSLGTKCESCHSPNGWKVWDFDHNLQTKFALTGRHARLECGECHRAGAASMRLPTDCASCHRDNDVHLGQFGAQCQRCHNTITFKGARIQ
jgi:hypothetical protein